MLATFDAVAAERNGKVAVLGRVETVVEIGREALALPDGGAAETATRTLEPRAGEARVRFIDETADYQTGAVVVRSDDAAATAGGVDLDLPLVCGGGLATAAAQRALDGESVEARTLALGPLEALQLEPGDGVRLEGRSDDWRVTRVTSDETPSAVLEPVSARRAVEDDSVWRGGETPTVIGAPFLKVLDLPPLIGGEADAWPLIAVAAEPWRTMRLHAGPTAETLTARGDVETPATVGVLFKALGPGVRHRWDEANAVVVRVEGEAPESAVEAAVLGGGNALAVETAMGWEIVQYRSALLVGPGTWRLTGLLRGQQGTEVEMRAGAMAGSVVVFLDDRLARAEMGRGERGLPLLCRAGPAGAAPGGAGFSETLFVARGVHDRPWSPSGLMVETSAEGLAIRWMPRVRLFGDSWDGEPTTVDPMRFRLRVVDHDVVVRTMEVEGLSASYSAADLAADFPQGMISTARIGVAQWGEGFGWGPEAEVEAEIRPV